MSLPFFPSAAPDELFYSLVARYQEMAGHLPPRLAAAALLGHHDHAVSWDLPRYLGPLSKSLGITPHALIGAHTLFPYYARALLPATARRIQSAMASPEMRSGIHARTGITASQVAATRLLRYCPACAESDRADWGTPVWHRLHQCPGVWFCPVHDTVLWETQVQVAGRGYRQRCVLLEEALSGAAHPLQIVDAAFASLVARRSRQWFEAAPPHGPVALYREHRRKCAGFITRGDRLRLSLLRERLSPILPREQLRRWGIAIDLERDSHWVVTLLRSPRKSAHPLLHILLDLLLEAAIPEATVRMTPVRQRARHRKVTSRATPAAMDADRKAWIASITKHGDEGTTALRRRAPALHARLYRHSRDWLQQANMACTRVARYAKPHANWNDRDVDWCRALPSVRQAMIVDATDSHRRISRSALLRRLGLPSLHPVQLAKLPGLAKALAQAEETQEQWLCRRLQVAAKAWGDEYGTHPRPWELLRAARVHWPWPNQPICSPQEHRDGTRKRRRPHCKSKDGRYPPERRLCCWR